MRHPRILAMTAAALVGAAMLLAPPASAASQTVAVDCGAGTVANFTVAPGDVIVFDLAATDCDSVLGPFQGNQGLFEGFIASSANLSGTGGSVISDLAGKTVTYTAGSRSGTDTFTIALPSNLSSLRRSWSNDEYFMTVPGGGAGPEPWIKETGRLPGATCPTGWNTSWAQWMNGATGGFICITEFYFSSSTGVWDYRKG